MKGVHYNVYTEPRGDLNLRMEICRRALRCGQLLTPDTVAITNGCTEALSVALQAVTSRGDTVAIESPTYFGLLQLLEALGLNALELPTDADEGLDVDALERALRSRPVKACLFSSGFNNPLGCAMTEEKKGSILALLETHGVPLIEDDIYGDIYFGPARPRPFMALAPNADVTYCSSFSKTLAPGYRVGWIAAPRHMEKVLEAKFALTLCGAALPQAALAEFLSSGGYDSHLRRMRRAFAENIDRMSRAIDTRHAAGRRLRPMAPIAEAVRQPPFVRRRYRVRHLLPAGRCFLGVEKP